MNIMLYWVFPIVLVLGALIFFHELGHFLVAKLCKVKVLKFSLGFGPKLVGKKIGETEYLISAIPMGGYVKMLGENETEDEPIPPQDEDRAFNRQHALKRIAIVAAGPIFNVVLAVVLYFFMFVVAGTQVMIPEIGQVRAGSPAENAGLRKGDLIVAADGKAIEDWREIKDIVQSLGGQPVTISVKRDDNLLAFKIVPEKVTEKNLFGEDVKNFLIGVVATGKFKSVPLDPLHAFNEAIRQTWEITELMFLTIVKLFQGIVPLKTLGGPIMIGEIAAEAAKVSYGYLIPITALISLNLAILNLLPIPILDGGVIIFLLIELVIGKPISLKRREQAQKVGLFFLIALMAVVMYNDLSRVIGRLLQ